MMRDGTSSVSTWGYMQAGLWLEMADANHKVKKGHWL